MIDQMIEELRRDDSFMANVRRWSVVPAVDGSYVPLPSDLDERIQETLGRRGIDRLYSHQARAFRTALDGKNFVIVTPTASGKTLSYNLPVLQTLLNDSDARALYLFPTKALSQDQQAELNRTVEAGSFSLPVVTFDGDTPPAIRTSAKTKGRIIISNPDMLHTGIMPNHTRWNRFFQNLRYVVIDELHMYRGIFGSHVANVIGRLKRILTFYGAEPQFICCSATIGNPKQLAESIVGAPVELIEENGAPGGEKHIVLYNPPLIDPVQGIRKGIVHTAEEIAVRLLRGGVKTIVFAKSRIRTEIIAEYMRRRVANIFTDNERIRIEAYRGGYLPKERREIERGLRDGEIHGVVSTNALELGIDIGGLDASILGGFPGTIAAALQQSGRAGRRLGRSLAVLIASSSPLDQFIVEHAEYFLGRNPEAAYINPGNPYILSDHVKCAVFELPFRDGEGYSREVAEHLAVLESGGIIRRSGDAYHWADQSYPSEGVSLRSASGDNVVIVDTTGEGRQVIGEMDRPSAKELLFTNAIYIHRGTQYVVTDLDLENRRCYVERSDRDYFTDALVKRDVTVLTEDDRVSKAGATIVSGDVLVRSIAAKFKKIRFESHENVGYGTINLPEEEMHTRAAVVLLEGSSTSGLSFQKLAGAARPVVLQRLAGLMKNVSPAFLMSGTADLGVHTSVRDAHFGVPSMVIYDRYPGGSGLSEAFTGDFDTILTAARERVERCPCTSGCPSCIGPADPNDGFEGNPKEALLTFLRGWDTPWTSISG